VCDDCVSRQRTRKLSLEAPDTLGTGGRTECPHGDVPGQSVTAAGLCDDDHFVDTLGERPDFRDCRCEHGMRRIDALGQENEPPHGF
jgi:hypothetical protein